MYDIRNGGITTIEEVRFDDEENVTEEYATVVYKAEDVQGGAAICVRTEDDGASVLLTHQSAQNLIQALEFAIEQGWGYE